GNISRVASELGLSRVGLRNKLSRYDLKKNGKGHALS
ncbi:MAG: helix-turn-helix domain-containing protein, partial [Bradyrhizobium sp.]|nr:helix-turn-helix domain-containing protein [Bradyrhizobium sp.]